MLSVEKRSDPLFGINGFLLRRQSRAIPSRPSEEISPELFEFDRIREVRIEWERNSNEKENENIKLCEWIETMLFLLTFLSHTIEI